MVAQSPELRKQCPAQYAVIDIKEGSSKSHDSIHDSQRYRRKDAKNNMSAAAFIRFFPSVFFRMSAYVIHELLHIFCHSALYGILVPAVLKICEIVIAEKPAVTAHTPEYPFRRKRLLKAPEEIGKSKIAVMGALFKCQVNDFLRFRDDSGLFLV